MKIVALITLGILAIPALAQDSLVVYQKNASMFTNQYVFFKDATFKHYFFTDDGQVWYGKGNFIDKGNKRILKFGNPDLNYKLEFGTIHYEANFEREIKKSGARFKSKDYYNTSRKNNVLFEANNN